MLAHSARPPASLHPEIDVVPHVQGEMHEATNAGRQASKSWANHHQRQTKAIDASIVVVPTFRRLGTLARHPNE